MNSSVSVNFEDLLLTCINPKCKKEFSFPATEQDFFFRNKLENPKRCPTCRERKRAESERQAPAVKPYRAIQRPNRDEENVNSQMAESRSKLPNMNSNEPNILERQSREIRALKDEVEKLWDAIDELMASKRPMANLNSAGFKRY